jgi:hypothetical protein
MVGNNLQATFGLTWHLLLSFSEEKMQRPNIPSVDGDMVEVTFQSLIHNIPAGVRELCTKASLLNLK